MGRRVALVTGAGSGIGRAVALALANAGFEVVLAGRRLTLLNEVAGEGGESCVPMSVDVTDEHSVKALFARIQATFGRLDLLFNNAGVGAPATALEDLSAQQWRAVIDTNLTGAFLCSQQAFRLMKRQEPRGGRIINNGSVSATAPRPRSAAYTASKHAITGLTKSLSLEGREFDIACGQIDIGNASTAMTEPHKQGALQADLSIKPEPTFGVEHVANAVLYIANLPLQANVLFMTLMASKMPLVGRG